MAMSYVRSSREFPSIVRRSTFPNLALPNLTSELFTFRAVSGDTVRLAGSPWLPHVPSLMAFPLVEAISWLSRRCGADLAAMTSVTVVADGVRGVRNRRWRQRGAQVNYAKHA
ncbi:hypothetical protein [Nocardia implantans]|uniref:Uncharacterized protein n=1 Tax=Nocardia implantans TaxID=3108168 RepID=A0ABU6AVW5_9NOCA|nr:MULTISPECIES: hypothetical protein [unclassified Nocardia]MBF6192995.1 hypothetical protein [Nocardia beijingensis]MEA3532426.1 hypothetical protein [Nocardia sp. CDC192]MEB3511633.1 hypothetical protein [Nocardia sp. CDC186]